MNSVIFMQLRFAKFVKVIKSQDVFSFSSHLQKNARNQCSSTVSVRLKSWLTVILRIFRRKWKHIFWIYANFTLKLKILDIFIGLNSCLTKKIESSFLKKFLSLEHMEKNQNKYCLKLRNIHEIRDSVFRKHVPDARKYSLRTDFTQLWNGSSNIPLYVAQGIRINSGVAFLFFGLSYFFNFYLHSFS